MRRKTKAKTNKKVTLRLRLTEEEANRIRILAGMYAGGNVSKWLRYAGLNARRKVLKSPKNR